MMPATKEKGFLSEALFFQVGKHFHMAAAPAKCRHHGKARNREMNTTYAKRVQARRLPYGKTAVASLFA